MSETRQNLFTDSQTQQLVLAYLYSRRHEEVPLEDVHAFLNACIGIVSLGTSISMAADGLLLVNWDKDTKKFAFGLTEAGRAKAEHRSSDPTAKATEVKESLPQPQRRYFGAEE